MANSSASYPPTPPSSVLPVTIGPGSPTQSNPVFHPLRIDEIISQSPGATISRPDSPFPFLRQYSNNSQHGSVSTHSSPLLQYLSPPIIDIDSGGETPPYKPEPDDYFSLNMLGHRRKGKTGPRRSDPSGSRDASCSGSTPLLSVDETRSQSPDGYSSRESEKANDRGDVSDSALATQIWAGEKAPGQNATEAALAPTVRERRPHGLLHARVPSDPTFSNILATSDMKYSESGESSPEFSGTVRIWSTGSSITNRRKNNASEGSRRVNGKKRSPWKLGTPATIVLRKASVMCGATFAVTEHGLQTPGASALLTSQSQVETPVANDDQSQHILDHARYLGPSLLSAHQGAANGEVGSLANEEPEPNSEKVKPAERLVSISSLIGPSTATGSAIPFADVHTAPGTLSITATSQRGSLLPLAKLRHKSAVRVLSRSSVHEVIWEEDDLPSGGSSGSACSPSPSLTLTSTDIGGREDDIGTGSAVFAENLSTSPPNFMVSESSKTISSDNAGGDPAMTFKSDDDLSRWSWNRRPSTETNVKEEPEVFHQHKTSTDSSQESSLRKRSTVRRKKNIILLFVESLPPPLQHKPAQGQDSINTNFNDSYAGHIPCVDTMPPTLNDFPTSSPTRCPSRRRRSSSSESHPYASARVGQDNKGDCTIRTSSHKRRTSRSAQLRPLSQPGPDPSELQEPKPAMLRRISTVINWSGKEESDPMYGSSPNSRSVKSPSYFANKPGGAPKEFAPLTLTAEATVTEACPHSLPKVGEPSTDFTGSTYTTQPLKLVSTPDARRDVDCRSGRRHYVAEATVSMD